MEHMGTDFMLAEVVTKPLGVATFKIYDDRLMNIIGQDEFWSRIIALYIKEAIPKIGGENNALQATLLGDALSESHGSVLLDRGVAAVVGNIGISWVFSSSKLRGFNSARNYKV